jgi:light-regulated signal transduction histidine kinase (bacteriophytochrome)
MGELIDDLLKLSRVTRSDMIQKDVDLSAVAEKILEDLKASAPRRRVECLITPGLAARGDPELLTVALENLIGNAWKFTAKQPEAKIEFGAADVEGKKAFFIRDNGAGFDMAHSGKLFGVFQRLHDVKDFAGTGIGLATVQRIIYRHRGDIWAQAHVDRGAVFYFTLPL